MVQSQQNYIGINGIVTQDLSSIIAELESYFKGVYGENINLESNTSDGQWLNILAQQKIDALDFQVQLYNNLDVDSVVGLPQQVLYKLNGLTIKDYTYSWVYVNLTISQNVTLSGLDGDIANTDGTGYTVTDINGNNWILAESISLVASEAPYLLLFRAQELGQITALANTITNMSTIVAGVTEVNNPANNFITGQTGETAAEFRTRRNRSLQAPSQGFKESIEGQLLALNDVSDAKLYDNKDDVNIDGVQVIVQGGTSNEIGNIIYNNLPPGINTQGAYEATITVNNRNKVLNYDKPNPIPILVKGTIESLTGYPNDVDLDYVKHTLASKQFNIGEIAESANITTELKNILGETGSPYDIELSLGSAGGSWSEIVTVGTFTEYQGWRNIQYINNKYVIVGDKGLVAFSDDGETYSSPVQVGGNNYWWDDILYDGTQYVMVGGAPSSDPMKAESGYVAKSTDGTSWTTEMVQDGTSFGTICYGNGTYLIGGTGGYIVTSTDLSTYNSQQKRFDNVYPSWNTFYLNDKFVAFSLDNMFGNRGYITSEDATNWSDFIGLPMIVRNALYVNSKYILVGTNGNVATSDDLLSWDIKQVGNINWSGIVYADNLYTMSGGNKYIAQSSDLINWTTQQVGSSLGWQGIATNGTDFAIAGYKGETSTYTIPEPVWEEILIPTGLADFYVMTVSGMDNLTVLGAD